MEPDWPVWSAFSHEGAARRAVLAAKYGARPELAQRLGQLLHERLCAAPQGLDLPENTRLVPVPTSASRLAERGYNAATLLAQGLARAAGLSLAYGVLVRRHNPVRQAGLTRGARLSNVSGDISARKVPGGPLLLVDDVLTTGATLSACRTALLAAGADVVGAVVLNVALEPRGPKDGASPA